MKKCYTHYYNIGKFISNIGDNWRNCIYVTCSVCKHDKQECCDDLLVSFDETGIPTIIMVQDANVIFGIIVDKSECLAEISNVKFIALFYKYFNKRAKEDTFLCPFLNAVKLHPNEL